MCKRLRDRMVRPELLTCKESLNERKAIIRHRSLYSECKNSTLWRKNQRRCPHTIDRCFHVKWFMFVEQNLELCRDFQGLSFERVRMYTAITNKSLYLLELLCNGDSVDDWDFNSKNSSRSTCSTVSFMTLSLIPPVYKSHVPCQMTMHFKLLWSLL